MSKRNQHMEEWLRQAAAQEPETSSDQVKQQAWKQLSNMLDNDDAAPRLPRSNGWWMILVEVLVLAGTFMLMEKNSIHGIKNAKQQTLQTTDAASKEKEDQLTENNNNLNSTSQEEDHLTENNNSLNSTSQEEEDQLTENNNTPGSTSQEEKEPLTENNNTLNPTSQEEKYQLTKNNNTPGSSPKYTRKNTRTPAAKILQSLATKQLFIPVKDSGLRNQPAPDTLRTHKKNKEERKRSPYSLRIAAITPTAEAYGIAANIEYTLHWRKNWRVRPYLGAEYLTGFNREYDHHSYSVSPSSPGSPAQYKADSISTHFTLHGMLYGKAGVQAAYAFSKWEISAGIEYRYLAKAFGKDTFIKGSSFRNNIPPYLQPVLFNKKQVTGTGNTRLQLGLDYWITHRLQAGAIYYMQLNQQTLDATYRKPHSKLPDQTALQIHVRYFLRTQPLEHK